MTIPESLAAIASVRPDLVGMKPPRRYVTLITPSDDPFLGRLEGVHVDNRRDQAMILLWAFETAAREGLDFAVAQVAGESSGVCGPRRSERHACPTEAALAALAVGLTTKEPDGPAEAPGEPLSARTPGGRGIPPSTDSAP